MSSAETIDGRGIVDCVPPHHVSHVSPVCGLRAGAGAGTGHWSMKTESHISLISLPCSHTVVTMYYCSHTVVTRHRGDTQAADSLPVICRAHWNSATSSYPNLTALFCSIVHWLKYATGATLAILITPHMSTLCSPDLFFMTLHGWEIEEILKNPTENLYFTNCCRFEI